MYCWKGQTTFGSPSSTSPTIYTPASNFSAGHKVLYSVQLTSRLERREEGCIDLASAVNSETIDAVIRDEVSDPALPHTKHVRILGREIRERDGVISLPADLDAGVVVVVNETEGVVV